jgi:cobalt-precorrin-5B (C1)-methyltransferase
VKDLRSGYTTGTCAAAAACAAVQVLSGQEPPDCVQVELPDGDPVQLAVEYARGTDGRAEAAVRKDAGDDPDVTHGALVVVEATWAEGQDIELAAGEGVGTVTRPGLQVAPGEPAINPVPRRMICQAVRAVTSRPVRLTVSVPGGAELAEQTFNPRLGIEGGISILGTTGRVRPFSCPALRQSLACALDVAVAGGVSMPVLVPGHVGERAARRHLHVEDDQVIPVSNEWGFMVDRAARDHFDRCLVVGHPGKLAKLADGHWDTHSSRSPSAVPIVLRLAEEVDVPAAESNTTEGVFAGLPPAGRRLLGDALAARVRSAVNERADGCLTCAVMLVNMAGDVLGTAGDLPAWGFGGQERD